MFICLLFCEVSSDPVWVDRYRKELCRDCCCLSPNEGLARGTRVTGGDFLSVSTFRSLLVFVVFFFHCGNNGWKIALQLAEIYVHLDDPRLECWFWGRLHGTSIYNVRMAKGLAKCVRYDETSLYRGSFSYILLFLGRENRLVEVRYERFLCNCHIEEYEGILLTSRNDQIELCP